ncbi:hypothetical protein [Caudoviricetes sp.]|nr:hypothetical protein [Caudoviricetes sp.]
MPSRAIFALPLLLATAAAASDGPSARQVARVRLALERLPTTPEDRASESRPAELDQLARSIALESVIGSDYPRDRIGEKLFEVYGGGGDGVRRWQ